MAIDSITHRKLAIVKQLYQQALVRSLSSFSASNKIITVVLFDLSAETLLKTVVSFLDSAKLPLDSFQGVIQQCEALMSKSNFGQIPDKAHIQYVHSLRNNAQHQATYPNDSDVNDCRTYTRDFLNSLLNQIWGLSIDKISLTELIQDQEIKKYLVDAEDFLVKNNYLESVKSSATGLTRALMHVQSDIVGQTHRPREAFMMSDGWGQPEADREVFHAFQRIQNVVLYLSLGIDYSEYMHYTSIAGHIDFSFGGGIHHFGIKEPLQPNDAEFVVAYCIETVIKIEDKVGKLDAPFGKESFFKL